MVTQTIEEFLKTMLEGKLKSCTGGVTTSLAIGNIASTLQIVEREHGILKESVWGFSDEGGARRINMT